MISTAGEVGPCSACPSRSAATSSGSAVVVGDDGDLGRPGEQVDPNPAEQLALGLGDIGVAGADDHVGRVEALDSERHRRERLDAAEAEDLIGAGGRHRVAASPGRCPRRLRRRTRDDPLTPATLGTMTVMNADASIG